MEMTIIGNQMEMTIMEMTIMEMSIRPCRWYLVFTKNPDQVPTAWPDAFSTLLGFLVNQTLNPYP